MKKIILSLVLVLFSSAWAKPPDSLRLDFVDIPVGKILQVVYHDVLDTPYLLTPEVITDQRLVSFRWNHAKGEIKPFMVSFLRALGYSVTTEHGVDLIKPSTPKDTPADEVFVYRPKHRDVAFLNAVLSPFFAGKFGAIPAPVVVSSPIHPSSMSTSITNGAMVTGSTVPDLRQLPSAVSSASVSGIGSVMQGGAGQNMDVFVYTGKKDAIERLKTVLEQIDVPAGEVMVRAVVYEVSTTKADGSAFGLLANILGNLSVGVGVTTATGSLVRFKDANFDGVYSLLSTDGRFKVISTPSMRVRHGTQGTFSVGDDVPVLGAVTFPANGGQAVQSIEYKSSGVIFGITPSVHADTIDLLIDQQLSNFSPTTTGVNQSPTLTKRALKTQVSVQDGDLIVLGGLTQNKKNTVRDGLQFLPSWLHTTGEQTTTTEVLLVLQVQRL